MAKTEIKPVKLYCVVAASSEGGSELIIERTKKKCFDKAHELYRNDYLILKEAEELDDDYINRREFQKQLEGNEEHCASLCGTEDCTLFQYFVREV